MAKVGQEVGKTARRRARIDDIETSFNALRLGSRLRRLKHGVATTIEAVPPPG
jgi:hypothetical protein